MQGIAEGEQVRRVDADAQREFAREAAGLLEIEQGLEFLQSPAESVAAAGAGLQQQGRQCRAAGILSQLHRAPDRRDHPVLRLVHLSAMRPDVNDHRFGPGQGACRQGEGEGLGGAAAQILVG